LLIKPLRKKKTKQFSSKMAKTKKSGDTYEVNNPTKLKPDTDKVRAASPLGLPSL
jgi:hypothetical protein